MYVWSLLSDYTFELVDWEIGRLVDWEIGKLGYRYIGEGRIGGTGGMANCELRVGVGRMEGWKNGRV
jgi:hypothetical protein